MCSPAILLLRVPLCAGILWNLSSSDNLKDRLARDTLEQLTDLVLVPLSGLGGSGVIQQNPSEAEIFYNSTGFLRYLLQVLPVGAKFWREKETGALFAVLFLDSARVAVGNPLLSMTEPCSHCRNLSSASQQTRQKMRECHGLVDSMIHYVNSSLEVGKSEDKVSPELVLGELRRCSPVPLCKGTP